MISKMIICQTLMFTMRLMTKEPQMTEMPDITRTHLAPGGVVHDAHIAGVDDRDDQKEEEREAGQDPPGHPALRGQCLHRPLKLEALPDRVNHLVEHFGGVAPRLPLECSNQRDLLELSALHSLHDHVKRLVDRNTELLVCHDPLELRPGRLRGVVHDDRESADEAMAGPESRREHLEVVRKLFGEKLALPLELLLQAEPYSERYYEGEDDREEK